MSVDRKPVAAADRVDRHLRARDGSPQPTTALELFFDLVYVLAITQLSHLLLVHLGWTSAWRGGFLLLVVWWAWINTTWMVNWLDPDSGPVRALIVLAGLASLIVAAALPEAFGAHGPLFAGAYVVLQVGRNAGSAVLLRRQHPLGEVFERLTAWSIPAGALWLAGGLLPDRYRLALWAPALLVELGAPMAGYWLPGAGRMYETPHPIDGGHFAERCQGFVIIALGESVALTGAEAGAGGLRGGAVVALAIAFLETSALWWLYFGEVARHSRALMERTETPVDLAREAYTYLHVPIVAGVILNAVGAGFLTEHPSRVLDLGQAAVTVGGPALFLAGEVLFRLRMIRSVSPKRCLAVLVLVALLPLATHVSALVLGLLVLAVLAGLGIWEFDRPRPGDRRPHSPAPAAPNAPVKVVA